MQATSLYRNALEQTLRTRVSKATTSLTLQNRCMVLLGSLDTSQIASGLIDFVSRELGSEPVEVLSFRIGLGATCGMRLRDGRRIFLKIHSGYLDFDELAGIYALQEKFRLAGIPCARLLVPPTEYVNGKPVVVHAFSTSGTQRGAADPGVIGMAASCLADLVRIGREIDAATGLENLVHREGRPGRRNPMHENLLGIEAPVKPKATPEIDALIGRVRGEIVDAGGDMVVGHNDWTCGNLLFSKSDVSCVFDFESLVADTEPVVVGMCSVSFVNERSSTSRIDKPPEAATEFVRSFERARGQSFSAPENEIIRAATRYAVARFCKSTVPRGVSEPDALKMAANFDRYFMR